jgi:CubicO group peptidase (beta-lactamase class C family)
MKQHVHRFVITLTVPFIWWLLAGCVATADRTESTIRNQHLSLDKLAAQHDVCAVTIAIIKDRKLDAVESATGCQNTSAPNLQSIFQAASLSKTVFSYAVLKLVEQGKLELDAPIVKYLPQGYLHKFYPFDPSSESDLVTDPRLRAITVRMALNHSSGLPNWANAPLSFDAEPGTEWQYSGEGYVLLQRAVESITGERLDRFMTSTVLHPLGMNHSSYIAEARFGNDLVAGTDAAGLPANIMTFTVPVSAFTLYATIEDYSKFLVTILNDGQMLKLITYPSVVVDPDLRLDWGLGWGIERAEGDVDIWHWGNNPGYRAFVIASVQSGNGVVMLTNSENGLNLAEPVTESVLPGKHGIFQFYMLRDGLSFVICKEFKFCS